MSHSSLFRFGAVVTLSAVLFTLPSFAEFDIDGDIGTTGAIQIHNDTMVPASYPGITGVQSWKWQFDRINKDKLGNFVLTNLVDYDPNNKFPVTDWTLQAKPNNDVIFSGHIGIGVQNPIQALEVGGNIKATGTICDVNGCIGGGTSSLWQDSNGMALLKGRNAIIENGTLNLTSSTLASRIFVDSSQSTMTFFRGKGSSSSLAFVGADANGVADTGVIDYTKDGFTFMTGNTKSAMHLTQSGKIGIGTMTPTENLTVVGNISSKTAGSGYTSFSALSNSDTPWHAPFWISRRSRGNEFAPTAVQSGDNLGSFDLWGYDGNSYERSAQIAASVEGTVADQKIPSGLRFFTTNASGGLGERMRISADGNIGIGTSTPKSKLSVAGLSNVPPAGETTQGMVCITTVGSMWIDDDGVYDCK